MEMNQEYVFLVFKEARKLEFNQNTGERADVPVIVPMVLERGRVVKIDGFGITLENGTVVTHHSYNEAVLAKVFDEKVKEGVKSV